MHSLHPNSCKCKHIMQRSFFPRIWHFHITHYIFLCLKHAKNRTKSHFGLFVTCLCFSCVIFVTRQKLCPAVNPSSLYIYICDRLCPFLHLCTPFSSQKIKFIPFNFSNSLPSLSISAFDSTKVVAFLQSFHSLARDDCGPNWGDFSHLNLDGVLMLSASVSWWEIHRSGTLRIMCFDLV